MPEDRVIIPLYAFLGLVSRVGIRSCQELVLPRRERLDGSDRERCNSHGKIRHGMAREAQLYRNNEASGGDNHEQLAVGAGHGAAAEDV